MSTTPGFDEIGTKLMHELERDGLLGLHEVAEKILETAKENVPHGDPATDPHLGQLRDSGHIEPIETTFGKGLRIAFETDYGAVQEFAHYEHPRGGHSHFLERGLTEWMPKADNIVATTIRGVSAHYG